MYGICANHNPCLAEKGKSFLFCDLTARPAQRSSSMKKQLGFPQIGLFNAQAHPNHLFGRLQAPSHWIGSARFAPLQLPFCQAPEAAEAIPRAARGPNPLKKLRAPDELRPISADIHLVSKLEYPSQSTSCED
jgi:hypothetical protein